MTQKTILMHFDPNGRVKIEAKGYEGTTCMEATKPFEGLFGGKVTAREMVSAETIGHDMGERVR